MDTLDWAKPVVHIEGHPVRVLCTDRKFLHDERLTVVILIKDPSQGEILAACAANGEIFPGNEFMYDKYRVVNADDADV